MHRFARWDRVLDDMAAAGAVAAMVPLDAVFRSSAAPLHLEGFDGDASYRLYMEDSHNFPFPLTTLLFPPNRMDGGRQKIPHFFFPDFPLLGRT